MDEKPIVKVTILGEDFTLSGEKPVETIKEIADYVNRKMKQIDELIPSSSYKKIAVLAALNIAEEMWEMKEKTKDSEVFLDKTEKLIQILEGVDI